MQSRRTLQLVFQCCTCTLLESIIMFAGVVVAQWKCIKRCPQFQSPCPGGVCLASVLLTTAPYIPTLNCCTWRLDCSSQSLSMTLYWNTLGSWATCSYNATINVRIMKSFIPHAGGCTSCRVDGWMVLNVRWIRFDYQLWCLSVYHHHNWLTQLQGYTLWYIEAVTRDWHLCEE